MIKTRLHSFRAGFTLVEVLVAIAVLAIIILVAAKMTSTASSVATVSNKHIDANDQARMVFDRMADDFALIIRRRDADYLFWKNAAGGSTGPNDVMYFYTEGASYFDSTTFNAPAGIPSGATNNSEKNAISLVGYRVNNISNSPDYNQLERLGKALSWEGGAYNSAQSTQNSVQPNFVTLLTYPPAGIDVDGAVINPTGTSYSGDPTGIVYSTAYFNSTLAGAFGNSGNSGGLPSAVGTEVGNFNDSTDTAYRSIGSQVFRFEYSFQLKDGTLSDKPVMAKSSANGLPASYLAQTQRPLPTDDSANTNGDGACSIGTRWYDATNQIGYICLDATPNYAIWREIGIQDIAAIIVTIAVIDKQGLIYSKAAGGDLKIVAAKFPDYVATTATSTVTGDPAYLLDPTNTSSWAYALLPGKAVSLLTGANKLPQAMISQIRLYQRYFYLSNF